MHVSARCDQRCLSLIAACPHPTLTSGRSGPSARTRSPRTRNCRSLDRTPSGHTERRLSWAVARPRTRARIGDPALADATSRPPPTSLSVVGVARRLTREIRRSGVYGSALVVLREAPRTVIRRADRLGVSSQSVLAVEMRAASYLCRDHSSVDYVCKEDLRWAHAGHRICGLDSDR